MVIGKSLIRGTMAKQAKYYAVAIGRKRGIYRSWEECKQQVDGYSGAIYKSFDSEDKAKHFLSLNKTASPDSLGVCILCSRPLFRKGELCVTCKRKKAALQRLLFEHSNGRIQRVSNSNLLAIKQKYKVGDVFSFLEKEPNKYWYALQSSRAEKKVIKYDFKEYIRENTKIRPDEPIPEFVKIMLGPSKTAIRVSGSRQNPTILYVCKKCGETLYTRYNDYREHSGHNCEGIKSSGEVIVEDYLKKHGIKYVTQRDTLKCINPDTGYLMPYDFELVGKKVLIEVQGDQHRQFIPAFHVTMEGFEYQKKKDKYKKEFALQNGYQLIEIWYEHLDENHLSDIIL